MVLNTCRFCKHDNPADSNFCNKCGGQLNLVPCPRCGAVNDITAESCYQCHGPQSGSSTTAFDRTSPATEDFGALLRQHSQYVDEAAAFAEIEQIYHGLSQRETDNLDRPSPPTDGDRPEPLDPRSFTADVDRPYPHVPSSFTAVDEPYPRYPAATTDPRDRAFRRRRARRIRTDAHVILGTAILTTIAALGYYEYQQRFFSDALRTLAANSEQRARDDPAGAGAIRRDKAALKTIPGRDFQRAPTAKKTVIWDAEKVNNFWYGVWNGVKGKLTLVASLAPETPESAAAPAPEPATAATTEKKTSAPAPAKSASVPASSPRKRTTIVAIPAFEAELASGTAPAIVSFAIAPWGEIYVDGQKRGVNPPMRELELSPGQYEVEVRNTTFPAYARTIEVEAGARIKIKHHFR